jgi:hypothetical protein
MESTPTAELNLCDCCFKSINVDDTYCDSCGYPLKGSEFDQKNFIATRNSKEIDLEAAAEKIKKAGNVLYWIAGASVLSGVLFFMIGYSKDGENAEPVATLIVYIILGMIYLALASWSKKKPFAAIVSGLSLYIIVIVLSAIADPATIVQGIIIKGIFIAYFIKGIKSAIEAENLKKELNIG